MSDITDDIAAIKAALDAGPDAWGVRSHNGVIRDCISPSSHAVYEGGYTVPLYALAPDRIARLVEHIERLERDNQYFRGAIGDPPLEAMK